MTLYFSGNAWKYELEAVMKLFFPAEKFGFVFDAEQLPKQGSGDFCFFRRKQVRRGVLVYVLCGVGDACLRKAEVLPKTATETEQVMAVARLLFACLQKRTGKRPAWGVLTGVRPVKQVHRLMEQGKTEPEILQIMREEYLCTDQKTQLAFQTAMQQLSMPKPYAKGFNLYISIPFCVSRCSYCSFVSRTVTKSLRLIPQYVHKLCMEIEAIGVLACRQGLRLDTIYIGGGTPTALEAPLLGAVMEAVSRSFDLSDVREYTVEAGRADTITEEKLQVIRQNGAERISVNPQTLNDSVLAEIGRQHTAADFFRAYEMVRRAGFSCVNTDLIAGLPTDTAESFRHSITGILALSPENITVHTLAIKRASGINTEQKQALGGILANPAAEMVDDAQARLTAAGYVPYYLYRQKNMVDNLENVGWAKPGQESLYNIYIMEETQTILAAGAGAVTKLVGKNGLERVFNFKHAEEYIRNFAEILRRKEQVAAFYEKESE